MKTVTIIASCVIAFCASTSASHAADPDPSNQAVAKLISDFDALGANAPLHPRLFAPGAGGRTNTVRAALTQDRQADLEVARRFAREQPSLEVKATLIHADRVIRHGDPTTNKNWWDNLKPYLERMATAALLYQVDGTDEWLRETRARMQYIGNALVTRKCADDQFYSREYAWHFALAYDLAHKGLTADDKALVSNVITHCANGGNLKNVAQLAMDNPENGIAYQSQAKFVAALLLVRGDKETEATKPYLANALPSYLQRLSPWGGINGGFANGSSYALWDNSEDLLPWDVIDRVLKYPIYARPWLANLPNYIAYNVTPHMPAGAFGDGADLDRKDEIAYHGRMIMQRFDTPLSRWYVQSAEKLYGYPRYGYRLYSLLSPRKSTGPVPTNAELAPTAAFHDIGQTAMHSALGDPNRMSVLFRSSPWGAANHAHADQNSFVIYDKGQILAADSGTYDYFGSDHWKNWAKQTRAHNAITFDGGIGQKYDTQNINGRQYSGAISGFERNIQHGYDRVQGNAVAAYGKDLTGANVLTKARRTLYYIRPSTVIVVDQLSSDTERKWEYNLHTMVAPVVGGGGQPPGTDAVVVSPKEFSQFVIRDPSTNAVKAELCAHVYSPDGLEKTIATVSSPTKDTPRQHKWNRFAYRTASKQAMFISVLRTNCSDGKFLQVSHHYTGGSSVTYDNKNIAITPDSVTMKVGQ